MEWKKQELELIYAACMAYGNTLCDMTKEIPNEENISNSLGDRAKESWNLARKIVKYIKKFNSEREY